MDQFNLPDVGEGLTEAEIVSWKVKPGDTIKVNDIVCEIETAKSLVELPSPYSGTVAELLVSEGDTVEVGTPIVSIGDAAGAANGAGSGANAETESASGGDDEVATLVGYGPRKSSSKRRPRKQSAPAADTAAPATEPRPPQPPPQPAAPPPPPPPPAPAAGSPAPASTGAKVLAKPPVRKLAKDLGVDLAAVTPTGPNGTISRDDVHAHAGEATATAGSQPAAAAPGQPTGAETRIPIKGVRKVTAQAMVSSAFTAPHVTEWVTVDATRTMEMVERLRAHRDFRDVKVSPLLIVARACCVAMRHTPEVNAMWDEPAQEIVLKHYVNLGVAAATPRGLVVPNIKGADSMSAADLAQAIGALTATAREGKTQPEEMAGGTFTITNVGVFGVDSGTPILNPDQTGILAMGAIRKQPWVVDDPEDGETVVPRWITTLALSFDHRVVDGEQGSRFLSDVASIVEDPANALLF